MSTKSPVSKLQEYSVKKGFTLDYRLIVDNGGTHSNTFVIEVVGGGKAATGNGSSKKEAKHKAAQSLLESLGDVYPYTSNFDEDFKDFQQQFTDISLNNSVGELQIFCSKNNLEMPEYRDIEESGPAHMKVFVLECSVANEKVEASGSTKKRAKRDCSKKMLSLLEEKRVYSPFPIKMKIDLVNPLVKKDIIKRVNETKLRKQYSNYNRSVSYNVSDICRFFLLGHYPKSSKLNMLKNKDPKWIYEIDDSYEVATNILQELNMKLSERNLPSEKENLLEICIQCQNCSSNDCPSWSFIGIGPNVNCAQTNACVQLLKFLVTMVYE